LKHVVVGGIAVAVGATALLAPNRTAAAAAWAVHAPIEAPGDLARAFVEIRVAEVAGDLTALEAAPNVADGTAPELLRARIELARESIARRAKARTAREVAAAETEIGRSRAALAARIAGLANGAAVRASRETLDRCARELLLECVEDAILRRLAGDATEAALAVAWPSAEMRASAREALAEIDDPELGRLRMPRVQPRLSETPGRIAHAGLPMGVHNREIYLERLGLDEAEFASLRADGVI